MCMYVRTYVLYACVFGHQWNETARQVTLSVDALCDRVYTYIHSRMYLRHVRAVHVRMWYDGVRVMHAITKQACVVYAVCWSRSATPKKE